ncbi:MAG TPA: glutamate 5-kinase [Pseudomonadales bacterium]|nr:glutamate 5-kinase [Pseudomonadales bacterium]
MSNNRAKLAASKRWVVKIGSAQLTANGQGLDRASMARWVAQLVYLRQHGVDVVIVSSGAVAEGMNRLGWSKRPQEVHQLQAAAAVGQMGLIEAWESCFQAHQVRTAQILLTHDDLSDRKRYLNARSTLNELLALGVVPVINENDTVVTDEIRFGDNDTLAALVANLVEADVLLILTDQIGMYDADPRHNPNAKLIEEALAADPRLREMASDSKGALGRGGMATKVRAAALAARSGCTSLIASGSAESVVTRLFSGENVGTLLLPEQEKVAARKQWLASHLQMRGEVAIDDGAVRVLREAGKSLLPVGVKEVRGEFKRGEMISVVSLSGERIACGLATYEADEARQIMGKPSDQIETILGYSDGPELIHRDNLVLT